MRSFKIRTGKTLAQIDFSCEAGMYRNLLILNRNLERKENLRIFSIPKVCVIVKPIYKQMCTGKKNQSFKKCELTASILSNSLICSCAEFKHILLDAQEIGTVVCSSTFSTPWT